MAKTKIKTDSQHIRNYAGKPLDEDDLDDLLEAAKNCPIKHNPSAWHYIVIEEKDQLYKLPGFNPYLPLSRYSPNCILICGDSRKENDENVWVNGCSTVVHTMLEVARNKSLGGMWTPIYPDRERLQAYRDIFKLPSHLHALALVVVAHPMCLPEDANSSILGQQNGKKKKYIFF